MLPVTTLEVLKKVFKEIDILIQCAAKHWQKETRQRFVAFFLKEFLKPWFGHRIRFELTSHMGKA